MIDVDININLVKDVTLYLLDAGFSKTSYILNNFDGVREYIEVFFCSDDAIDFIIEDVKKTKFFEIFEIQSYLYKNDMKSAIFAYC